VILLDGEKQKTANDEENPTTVLIGKKAGKKIASGQPCGYKSVTATADYPRRSASPDLKLASARIPQTVESDYG
jgi:hypothetical protein